MNSNSELRIFGLSAANDLEFIKSRVSVCGVCDDQRSSLMVQLQSVSESPTSTIICRCPLILYISFSYEIVFGAEHPQYQSISM